MLGGTASPVREFYLPVPAGIPISDATLQMDASYLQGDGGRTSLVLSLDGSPVLARAFLQAQGDASAGIGVDGSPRPSGFLRVGLGWTPETSDNGCADQAGNANVMQVAPSSRCVLSFRQRRRHRFAHGVERIAANAGRRDRRQCARRHGLRHGLARRCAHAARWQAASHARPAQDGDTVSLGDLVVPASLRSFPAFAALAAGGTHTLANPAEVAALIGLAPPAAFAPDLIVMNAAMRTQVSAAVDALRAQVLGVSPDAAASFDAWRKRFMDPLTTPLAAGEVRLAHLAAQDIVMVGDPSGVSALAEIWRPIDVSNRLFVHQTDTLVHADTHDDRTCRPSVASRARWTFSIRQRGKPASIWARRPATVVSRIRWCWIWRRRRARRTAHRSRRSISTTC